jgi:hypothetical protein
MVQEMLHTQYVAPLTAAFPGVQHAVHIIQVSAESVPALQHGLSVLLRSSVTFTYLALSALSESPLFAYPWMDVKVNNITERKVVVTR